MKSRNHVSQPSGLKESSTLFKINTGLRRNEDPNCGCTITYDWKLSLGIIHQILEFMA